MPTIVTMSADSTCSFMFRWLATQRMTPAMAARKLPRKGPLGNSRKALAGSGTNVGSSCFTARSRFKQSAY